MGKFVKGEVIVIPFPYSDLSQTKRRPALVVAPLDGGDVVLCQITSINRTDQYSVSLEESDFSTGKLDRSSFIRTNHLFTADPTKILYSVGNISNPKIQQVINRIVEILNA